MRVFYHSDEYFEKKPFEKQRVCCNCRHRTTSESVSKCMIDGHYVGYVSCFTEWCLHWASDKARWGGRKEMTMEEAQEILQEIKHYLTAGNPVWDVDEIAEACDMAIEALRNEINCVKCVHYTERETYTGIKGVCKMDTAHREDLISIQMAIEHWGRSSGNLTNDQIAELQREIESLPSAEPRNKDAISREGLLKSWEELSPRGRTEFDQVIMTIPALPSAEPKTGKWIPVTRVYTTTENDFPYTRCEYVDATEPDEIDAVRCSECGEVFDFYDARNWCTQCGAYMRGEEE